MNFERHLESSPKSPYPFLGPLKEFVILGRSNAGKSSFINAFSRRRLAPESQKPGKTRRLGFFPVDDEFCFVDTPGYGYAKRSKLETRSWKFMMEKYLAERDTLKGGVLIMDVRRDWSEEEKMLASFLKATGKPLILILNKKDKLKTSELKKRKQYFEALNLEAKIFFVSCLKKDSMRSVHSFLRNHF